MSTKQTPARKAAKPRTPARTPARRSPNEQLLKDCHDAMGDAIGEWNRPDSPEGFAFAMKALMVLKERIAARLGLP